jgi:cobalt/nickel transport system permease protein
MTGLCPCCQSDMAPARPGRKGRGRSLARKTADSIGRAVGDVLENEEVAARPGLLQRLDPRVKLLSLLLLAVTVSLVHSVWVLLALVGLTLVMAAASRVGVGSFVRKVWGSAGLLAVLIALPSATRLITPGAVAVPLGALSLTRPGLMGAATLVARVVAAAGFSLLVVWTMRWTELLQALTALRLPGVIVATLAMAQKQILTLLRTVEQIHLARESRTVSRGTAVENRAWVTERMSFVVRKSIRTADEVYDAMLSRGFSGPVRSLVRLRMGVRDWVWAATCALGCTAVVLADRVLVSR